MPTPKRAVSSYNNNVHANNASQKIGWAPGRIPWEQFQTIVNRIGRPDTSKLYYEELTIADFQAITAEADMRKWDAKLVRIRNVWFTGEYENNGSFAKLTTGNPGASAPAFVATVEPLSNYCRARLHTSKARRVVNA